MIPTNWHDDDELLSALHAAVTPEPVPDRVTAAARGAFAWRDVDLDLEMLSLSFDSATAPNPAVRATDTSAQRMLVFDGHDIAIEIEVRGDLLMGQVVPARCDRLVVEDANGEERQAEVDDAGFFLLRRPPAGPARLRWAAGDEAAVTEWVVL